jgi:hypothetical protein
LLSSRSITKSSNGFFYQSDSGCTSRLYDLTCKKSWILLDAVFGSDRLTLTTVVMGSLRLHNLSSKTVNNNNHDHDG